MGNAHCCAERALLFGAGSNHALETQGVYPTWVFDPDPPLVE